MTEESPVENVPVVTLIRIETTLDHSQKAEKVRENLAALHHIRCVPSRDLRNQSTRQLHDFSINMVLRDVAAAMELEMVRAMAAHRCR